MERAATLDDVRAEVLAPNRVNALVFSGFAGVALAIAVVGVAGVLAFSVSARTREFGIRLAIGSTPSAPAGAHPPRRGGDWRQRDRRGRDRRHGARARRQQLSSPTSRCRARVPIVGAAAVLVAAAILASLMPAARASRVDVVNALRSE